MVARARRSFPVWGAVNFAQRRPRPSPWKRSERQALIINEAISCGSADLHRLVLGSKAPVKWSLCLLAPTRPQPRGGRTAAWYVDEKSFFGTQANSHVQHSGPEGPTAGCLPAAGAWRSGCRSLPFLFYWKRFTGQHNDRTLKSVKYPTKYILNLLFPWFYT